MGIPYNEILEMGPQRHRDTLRVVNQDVKREIFQNNLSRSILTVLDNSNKHSIYVKAGRNILS